MRDLRYLNLFGNITKIDTKFCFRYNEVLIFCIPKQLIRRAVGENGRNVKKLSEILRKKIKIIPIPQNPEHIRPFIESVVSPVKFKDLEVKDNEVILTAGSNSKAALIGRNKRRFFEMQEIIKDFFKKDFKII